MVPLWSPNRFLEVLPVTSRTPVSWVSPTATSRPPQPPRKRNSQRRSPTDDWPWWPLLVAWDEFFFLIFGSWPVWWFNRTMVHMAHLWMMFGWVRFQKLGLVQQWDIPMQKWTDMNEEITMNHGTWGPWCIAFHVFHCNPQNGLGRWRHSARPWTRS